MAPCLTVCGVLVAVPAAVPPVPGLAADSGDPTLGRTESEPVFWGGRLLGRGSHRSPANVSLEHMTSATNKC